MADRKLFFAFSNPVDGKEGEFNEWYDKVHVPEVGAVPGVVSAQRFDLHQRRDDPAPSHRYLTVYEIEGDPDEVMAAITDAAMSGKMTMSDALDRETAVISFWSPRGPKVHS